MAFVPLQRMWERCDLSIRDSDAAAFFDLMCLGELVVKTTVLGMIAGLEMDKQRHQYRLLHRLVRADGIGEWDQVLQEVLAGGPAHLLCAGIRDEQKALTMRVDQPYWQYASVAALHSCLKIINSKREKLPDKVDGRRWFTLFAELRNQTRGHGAHVASVISKITPPLKQSLEIFGHNFPLFSRPWAYVHRSLSGRYRVSPLSSAATVFDDVDLSTMNVPEGVYCYIDRPLLVPLLYSTAEIFDFYYPNGAFNDKRFECISYITGSTLESDASCYLDPPSQLPPSETQGSGVLELQGTSLSNIPGRPGAYVRRTELETELLDVLRFRERHQVVTLYGRGGIGKTSLALTVLYELAQSADFDVICWFSARDIDLLPDRPLPVSPKVLTVADVAMEFTRLTEPAQHKDKGFQPRSWIEECLREPVLGPTLFVFDNFETMHQSLYVFRWLDVNVRSPNKILITTRHHDFKGDYPIKVDSMTHEECEQLILQTAASLGMSSWITKSYQAELISESAGHPYVIKILLGEAKRAGGRIKIDRILADREHILDALFERTYARLTPAARRTFLTLSNWGASVPELSVEAVLLQAKHDRFDVVAAMEELLFSSFITRREGDGDQLSMIEIPLVAAVFGRKKLSVDPIKIDVDGDTELIRVLATSPADSARQTIGKMFQNVAKQIADGKVLFADLRPLLEFLSSKVPHGWLLLARLHEESGRDENLENSKAAVRRFLEATPRDMNQIKAWERLTELCGASDDFLGLIDAKASVCELPDASLSLVTNAAGHALISLRSYGYQMKPLEYRRKVKQTLRRIMSMLEMRLPQFSITEYTRMAWLCLVIDDQKAACSWTERALELEPGNVHCLSLAQRLGIVVVGTRRRL